MRYDLGVVFPSLKPSMMMTAGDSGSLGKNKPPSQFEAASAAMLPKAFA
jgi:hypothetical protein